MTAFYFDVSGVIIPDKFTASAQAVFRDLGQRHAFDADIAHARYTELQHSLDLGSTSLTDFCAAIGMDQHSFERDWLAMHPVDGEVISTIHHLLSQGRSVGLATNFCRRLLDLVIESAPGLSTVSVCCSSDIGVAKPSAEFFRRASAIIGSRDVVFVDDRMVNVEAARRFGWTAVHAANGWHARFRHKYLADSVGI
ncbi:MAG TPA: HAD-IA family hydrolase [Candidatus Acidoferrum sp.]|jgi:putative hydrolase of the HAD superfamily